MQHVVTTCFTVKTVFLADAANMTQQTSISEGKTSAVHKVRSPHVCFCILSHTDISFTLWHHWYMARVCRRGVPRIFHWGPRLKGRRLRAGVGFLEGQQPHPHPLGGMGSAVSSTAGFGGGAPTAQRFSTIFNTQDGLSWHYNIVNCGLSCSRWEGQDPRAPCIRPCSCVMLCRFIDICVAIQCMARLRWPACLAVNQNRFPDLILLPDPVLYELTVTQSNYVHR